MKFLDYFDIALGNLKKRKVRTFITSFAIAIGVMLTVTMVSLGMGLEEFMFKKMSEFNNLKKIDMYATSFKHEDEIELGLATTDENGNVDINSVFKSKKITDEVITKLTSNKEVKDLLLEYKDDVGQVSFGDLKINDVSIASYDGKFFLEDEKLSLEKEASSTRIMQKPVNYIGFGRALTPEDKMSVMIPESIVRDTFKLDDPSKIIGKKINIHSIYPTIEETKKYSAELTVIGVVDRRFFQPSFVVSKDVMEQVKNFNEQTNITLAERGIDTVQLSVKEIDSVVSVTNFIENELGYSASSVKNIATTLEDVSKTIQGILAILGIIVSIVAAMNVINTMLMSVMEKKGQIGLMKSLGASRRDIRHMFVIETLAIGLIGCLLGILLSAGFIYGIENILVSVSSGYMEFTPVDIDLLKSSLGLDFNIVMYTTIFATSLTIIAGLYPSIKASRLDPMDALKND